MLLALAISVFIWGVAQGSTDIRSSFDIPVEIHGVDEALVVTDQSVAEVNVGVMGSRAALNNLDSSRLTYEIDVANVKPGVAEFEAELASIELPRRARFVSHSPSRIQIRLERRSRKEVSVVADIEGDPAEGFALAEVRVVPDRVWLAGARSHVMRVADAQTELVFALRQGQPQLAPGSELHARRKEPAHVFTGVTPGERALVVVRFETHGVGSPWGAWRNSKGEV